MTSPGEGVTVFTSPHLSSGAPVLGEAKGLRAIYNISNIYLTLSLADLSKIRNKLLDKYKTLDLDDLVNKIDVENFDISYEYKRNNKIEYREQRIIIFGLKENIDLIKEKNTNEFFFDSTYKIIPPHFRPYKLGVLAGIPKKSDNPKLLCFILIKYNDEIAYSRNIFI